MSTAFLRAALAAVLAGALSGADTPFAWKNVNIQGMGYVTGLVIHPKPPHDIYNPLGRRRRLPFRPRRTAVAAPLGPRGYGSARVRHGPRAV